MAGDKRPSLDEFIASEIAAKDSVCISCSHEDAEQINEALRKADNKVPGYTISAVSRWCGISHAALRRHVEKNHHRGQ